MLKPLANRVFVKMDEAIPTGIDGFILAPDVTRWRGRDGAVESFNRGTVAHIGPDVYDVQPGDVIRFSEIQYPTTDIDGERFTIISDMDIVGVEQEGSYAAA